MLLKYKDNWNWGENLHGRVWEEAVPVPSVLPENNDWADDEVAQNELRQEVDLKLAEVELKLERVKDKDKDVALGFAESYSVIWKELDKNSPESIEKALLMIDSLNSRLDNIGSGFESPEGVVKKADFIITENYNKYDESIPEPIFVKDRILQLAEQGKLEGIETTIATRGGNLNLRDSSSSVIGKLVNNSEVKLTGQTRMMKMKNKTNVISDLPMVEITQGNFKGYVAAHYLKAFSEGYSAFNKVKDEAASVAQDVVPNVLNKIKEGGSAIFDKFKGIVIPKVETVHQDTETVAPKVETPEKDNEIGFDFNEFSKNTQKLAEIVKNLKLGSIVEYGRGLEVDTEWWGKIDSRDYIYTDLNLKNLAEPHRYTGTDFYSMPVYLKVPSNFNLNLIKSSPIKSIRNPDGKVLWGAPDKEANKTSNKDSKPYLPERRSY